MFSGCSLGDTGPDHDVDYYEPEDDGSVQKFSSKFEKVIHAKGDLSIFNGKKDLYTIQVNRALDIRKDTGYLYPNISDSRSADFENLNENSFVSISEGNIRKETPSFVYQPVEKPVRRGPEARAAGPEPVIALDTSKFKLGDNHSFYVSDKLDETNNGSTKNGVLKAEGEHCLVFVCDEDSSFVTKEKAESLRDSFEQMYALITNVMGGTRINKPLDFFLDTNGKLHEEWPATISDKAGEPDQKIIIFINDCFDDKDKGSVVGYFWRGDLYSTEARSYKYSNQCRMIYIDSYWVKKDMEKGTEEADSTLAHEFTHMINAIQKKLNVESWFTEMLAMASEDFMGSTYFNFSTTDESSVFTRLSTFNWAFPYGVEEKYWNGGDNISYNYANTYALGAYLMRNYGGIGLINKIATNEETGKEAITKALQDSGYDETYDSVFAKFGQVLINTDGEGLTLNKSPYNTYDYSTNFNGYKYKVVPLDLNMYKVWDAKSNKYLEGPVFRDINYFYNIYGRGIEVKHFGKVSDYERFDAKLPHSKSVDLYIYIK